MIPPGFEPHGLFVIVDLSGWIHRAYHLGGVDSIVSMCVGWLVDLLEAPSPDLVAVALDSRGMTWRHRITQGFPRARQYKAHREPRPPEFWSQVKRLEEIVALHRIPLLWADGFEADDCIATAVREARAIGIQTVVLSIDKDLHALVTDEAPRVWCWNGKREAALDATAVIERWGVPPKLVGDALAIMGDASDNIPGVEGLGPKGAVELLHGFGSLDGALGNGPPSAELIAQYHNALNALEKAVARSRRNGNGDELRDNDAQRDAARATLRLGKLLWTLHEHASDARLSARLVRLDDRAPIAWDPEELVVGGFDADRLRPLYQNLGFTALARQVRWVPKPTLADIFPSPVEEERAPDVCATCSGFGALVSQDEDGEVVEEDCPDCAGAGEFTEAA